MQPTTATTTTATTTDRELLREQTYPPPYPDGWYRVAASSELAPGAIIERHCLGQAMVLYRARGAEAAVRAMGAYCPHMGAGLVHGCVKADALECPFHLWQLGSDGEVAHIPYAKRLPPRARQKTWAVREQHGQVFLYHSNACDEGARAQPRYELPRLAELDDGRMVYRGQHDAGTVKMHLLEFAENSVDYAHFGPLHGKMFVPWTRLTVPGITIEHDAEWALDTDPSLGHLAYFKNRAILKVLGRRIEQTRAAALITFYGPAGVVTFRFTIPDLGEIVMFQTHLPLAPMLQKVDFRWYAEPKIPRLLVSYVVGNWVSQWQNDIAIWENKIHRARPLLVAEDGPIHRLRKWFFQFYPSMRASGTTGTADQGSSENASSAAGNPLSTTLPIDTKRSGSPS